MRLANWRGKGHHCHKTRDISNRVPLIFVNFVMRIVPRPARRRTDIARWSRRFSSKPSPQRFNLILVDYQIERIMVAPGAKGFPMKAILAICVAVTALWLADIELNDGQYGDVTGRTIMSLIGK